MKNFLALVVKPAIRAQPAVTLNSEKFLKLFLANPQNSGFITSMQATLHFHSISAKNVFVKRNKIEASEILEETPTSFKIENAYDFANSPFVYSITK